MNRQNRRVFLGSAAGAASLMLSRRVLGRSPNERVVTALIGCGGRGGRFLDHVDFLCDADETRLSAAAKRNGVASNHVSTDLRRLLDNPDIDAVVIATPDHWHAPAAILSCEAGKHAYVEKPISHNFRESQLLVDAARRHKRVIQHGTQMRNMPFVRDAVERLRQGVIGNVLMAKAWNVQRRPNIGHATPGKPPAGVDYDAWVGPAEFVPFQENRFHYNWHWWYNFGTGDIGNDGAHELDFARWGLGVDTLPSTVAAVGGKYAHDDDQQFPDTATCVFEYPGDGKVGSKRQLVFELRLWSTNYPENCDCGVEFFGEGGRMFLSKRGKFEIRDDRNKVVESERWDKESQLTDHFGDFHDAIRDNRATRANVDEAHRTVALLHLANIAVRLGRSIEFDPSTETAVGDDEANKMLVRTYRDGGHWAIPNGV